jgi:uncharacterized protein (TIGR02996 family)
MAAMSEAKLIFERALATAKTDPPAATRTLFESIVGGTRITPLAPRLRTLLDVLARRATELRIATPPASSAAATAQSLGDGWFQCPHCDDVFEGERAKCTACEKPLATTAPALEIIFDGGTRLWMRASAAERRTGPSELRYLATTFEWLRVEHDGRSFELLDEAGRAATTAKLGGVAVPPNVTPIGLRGDGRIVLAHATKLETHVASGGALHAEPHRTTFAGELVVREIANVVDPDESLPAPGAPPIAKGHARDAALEAAIEANPDDAEAYLVYADWLQAQGDPRGQLIVMQHAGKELAAAKLLDQHAPHFYGQVAEAKHMLAKYSGSRSRDTTWRWGFLEALWISKKPTNEGLTIEVEDALRWLLEHPSCRFLRELTVGIVTYDGNSYDDIAEVIGAHPRPMLRKLFLGDFYSEETELNWSYSGPLSPMYAALPNLSSLTLRAGGITIGSIDLPNLEELVIKTGGFDAQSLAAICSARWPKLVTLNLQLGRDHRFTLDELAPIFDARAFPHVKHLGLGNGLDTDELCRGLAASKIAAQLETLDLSEGTLGDDGATALAAGTWPKLVSIDAKENWLSDAGIAALGTIAKQVDARFQEDDDGDPENRYISGYE